MYLLGFCTRTILISNWYVTKHNWGNSNKIQFMAAVFFKHCWFSSKYCFSLFRFYIFIKLYNYHNGQEDVFWGNRISMGAYWNCWLLLKIVSTQKHFLLKSVAVLKSVVSMKCNKMRTALRKKTWWYSANGEKVPLLKTPMRWISHLRLSDIGLYQ